MDSPQLDPAAVQETEGPQDLAGAMLEETFAVQSLNVVSSDPGQDPLVTLRLLAGQIAPNVFVAARNAQLHPDLAIKLGEYLIREGRRVRSGLYVAGASQVPKAA